MRQNYEYRFIRTSQDDTEKGYRKVIDREAREGWRLVQVFAPGAGGLWGKAGYCEVILERQI